MVEFEAMCDRRYGQMSGTLLSIAAAASPTSAL
jgi:hypothetical protein